MSMPVYDYKCTLCGYTEEHVVKTEERDFKKECRYCQRFVMERQFPVEAIKQLQVWQPQYCEAFDCDINSKREWDQILKDKNAIEAGDKVRGGRNWDPKANNMMPQPPQGKQYVPEDVRRLERIKARAEDAKAMPVEVETGTGWKAV